MATPMGVHTLWAMVWLGEFLSIPERLVVAPAWGRWCPRPLSHGEFVEKGDVVGLVWDGRDHIELIAPVRGLFIAWMAATGERVRPGMAVARLQTTEA
jgi:hypothetical protein